MEDREESLTEILKVVNESDTNSIKQYNGITNKHWQSSTYSTVCTNRECRKPFKTFLESVHHCRRCGKLFCKKCVEYQRRLNDLARPDPNGRLHKVCKACYDQGPQSIGFSRSWTRAFRAMQRGSPDVTDSWSTCASVSRGSCSSFTKKLDMKKECERLIDGFKENIGNSEMKRTVVDFASVFSLPEWQKSSRLVAGNLATACIGCNKEFGLMRKKYNCCVCGASVCSTKSCSTKDLLIFISDKKCHGPDKTGSGESTNGTRDVTESNGKGPINDEHQPEEDSQAPEIAIIEIVGSPVKEPDVCLHLRICRDSCQQKLEDLQVKRYKSEMKSKQRDSQTDAWTDILQQCDRFRDIEAKIESQLPMYQDLVDCIEDGIELKRVHSKGASKRQSNTQDLAKAQSDLSDYLTQFTMMIFSLKQVTAVTNAQQFIFKNILKSKCQFYQENMFLFRESKKRLEESTPPEVLCTIQSIVDQNAVNSSYLSVKQLALEVLHLCNKHKLGDRIPMRIARTEAVMYDDLKREICRNPNEDWPLHEACLHEVLQSQLRDRRLIKPSRRLSQRFGSKHIFDVINERCAYVIRQVHLQLEQKSAAKQFHASKTELKNLLTFFSEDNFAEDSNCR